MWKLIWIILHLYIKFQKMFHFHIIVVQTLLFVYILILVICIKFLYCLIKYNKDTQTYGIFQLL